MGVAYKFVSLVVLLVVCSNLANADDTSLGNKCGAEFQKVAACLTFATGKSPTPSKECCDSAADIREKDPVCLCYIIEQIHKGSSPELKSMGIQEDKLLQLPSACKLANASISNCPKLLNIPPNSPDNAIFTNASASSTTPATTPAGGTSSSSSSPATKDANTGFKHGGDLSLAGTLVVMFVAVFLCSIPQEFHMF